MSIKYALLGLLNVLPRSGYDLKKEIAGSPVFYWSGNNNQIYRTLLQLHAEGLVSQEIQAQASAPARKIYTITSRGQAELEGWLRSAPELPELHNPFLIRLSWAADMPDQDVAELLDLYLAEVTAHVSLLSEQARRAEHGTRKSPRAAALWQRIHENLISHFQTELDWTHRLQREILE